jgi:hypothetical protein
MTSVVLLEAAPGKKARKRRAGGGEVAVPADQVPAASISWHFWTASSGEKLEAKFRALENGIVTVEKRDQKIVRFPIARLSAADQEFAKICKSAQPRPPMAQEIITKAAARIDDSINAGLKLSSTAPNPPTSDAQFVRRLYLDAIGRIPTGEEANSFLTDPSPDKRAKLINTLLNSPGYTMQMYNWLADMLRVKDDYGKGARAFLYEDWLKDQIAMNLPWDVMVRDMLTADGKLNENGAAGFLLRDAQMPLDGVSNLLTTFLGANVSCAQCHDHPFADWSQRDFYGMAAFFGATDGYHEDVYKKSRRLVKSGDISMANQKQVAREVGAIDDDAGPLAQQFAQVGKLRRTDLHEHMPRASDATTFQSQSHFDANLLQRQDGIRQSRADDLARHSPDDAREFVLRDHRSPGLHDES